MKIIPIPCLVGRMDNYSYLVVDEETRQAAVVDPSEEAPILREIEKQNVTLTSLWITHHHWDHVGAIEPLVKRFPELTVYGSKYDGEQKRIPQQTHGVKHGEVFDFCEKPVRVIENPGHTLGAISFHMGDELFTGDTLFLAGCGRVFEGSYEMMAESMKMLRALPPHTRIWCGHEYTVNNLKFAQTIEPDNVTITNALEDAKVKRARQEPTVPGTLADELQTNPFLRFDLPKLVGSKTPTGSFAAIRQDKDKF